MNNKSEDQIIDWETKGNVVRFYLGTNGEQWGDDWNDIPFEHNAGRVYEEFQKGFKDIAFEFGDTIIEPDYGYSNSPYDKEMMVKRNIPCLIVIKEKDYPEDGWKITTFGAWLGYKKAKKYYFGDRLETIQ